MEIKHLKKLDFFMVNNVPFHIGIKLQTMTEEVGTYHLQWKK